MLMLLLMMMLFLLFLLLLMMMMATLTLTLALMFLYHWCRQSNVRLPPQIYRILPYREPILEGILSANLIGFQTYDYARHFLSTVESLLDANCSPQVRTVPRHTHNCTILYYYEYHFGKTSRYALDITLDRMRDASLRLSAPREMMFLPRRQRAEDTRPTPSAAGTPPNKVLEPWGLVPCARVMVGALLCLPQLRLAGGWGARVLKWSFVRAVFVPSRGPVLQWVEYNGHSASISISPVGTDPEAVKKVRRGGEGGGNGAVRLALRELS